MDDLIREMLEPERPAPGVQARRRRLGATVTIIGLAAVGIANLTTNALFTDGADVSPSGFVSGTVSIDATAADFALEVPGNHAAPGDHHYRPITVQNVGSLQLRYATEIAGTGDAELLNYLDFSVQTGLTEAACTAQSGPATSGVIGQATLGSATHWIGNAASGDDSGDRTLASGASEVLCLGLHFDIDAPNSVAGDEAGLAITFHAEQTANNP